MQMQIHIMLNWDGDALVSTKEKPVSNRDSINSTTWEQKHTLKSFHN